MRSRAASGGWGSAWRLPLGLAGRGVVVEQATGRATAVNVPILKKINPDFLLTTDKKKALICFSTLDRQCSYLIKHIDKRVSLLRAFGIRPCWVGATCFFFSFLGQFKAWSLLVHCRLIVIVLLADTGRWGRSWLERRNSCLWSILLATTDIFVQVFLGRGIQVFVKEWSTCNKLKHRKHS